LTAYADTSFIASLYVLDENSPSAAEKMARAQLPVVISALVEFEFTNAVSLRVFRHEISRSLAKASHATFARDIQDGVFLVQPITSSIFDRAKQIAKTQTPVLGTRSLDVLHVAAALVLRADRFWTFDRHQRKLAATEGFKTE
jgi:predicted nucleic acid-binding protein